MGLLVHDVIVQEDIDEWLEAAYILLRWELLSAPYRQARSTLFVCKPLLREGGRILSSIR